MPRKQPALSCAQDLHEATFHEVPHSVTHPELVAAYNQLTKVDRTTFDRILIEAGFEARRDRTSCMFVNVTSPVLELLARLGFTFTTMMEDERGYSTGSLSWAEPGEVEVDKVERTA